MSLILNVGMYVWAQAKMLGSSPDLIDETEKNLQGIPSNFGSSIPSFASNKQK